MSLDPFCPFCPFCGFRYYMPEQGRWASRDPVGEEGGVNLFSLLQNYAVGQIDLLGLQSLPGGAIFGPKTVQIPTWIDGKPQNMPWELVDRYEIQGGFAHTVKGSVDKLGGEATKLYKNKKSFHCHPGETVRKYGNLWRPRSVNHKPGWASEAFLKCGRKRERGTGPVNNIAGRDASQRHQNVDRGHLIADSFGGQGIQQNIVVMESGFNQSGGEYFELEREIEEKRKESGNCMCMLVIPKYRKVKFESYTGFGLRSDHFEGPFWQVVPKEIYVLVKFPDGTIIEKTLKQPDVYGIYDNSSNLFNKIRGVSQAQNKVKVIMN